MRKRRFEALEALARQRDVEIPGADLGALDADQLALRAAPYLRSVGEIAAHIIGARARWFYLLMGEGGEEFEALGKWDRRGKKAQTAEELVRGLEETWVGMHDAQCFRF